MNYRLILRLPPKSKILVYAQILWVMIMLWLRDVVGLPSLVTYVTDVFVVCLLIFQMQRIRYHVRCSGVTSQSRIISCILICILVGVILNLVNPMLVLWAARNNLRFYAFFFICIGVLDVWDIDKIFSMLKKWFWINVAMASFQYFALGLDGDHLGGFFGIVEGCNAFLNILMCSVMAKVMAEYFTGKLKLGKLILYLTAMFYVALLAELKLYYAEAIMMFLVAEICTKPSVKTVLLCLLGVLVLGLAFYVLIIIDPQAFAIFMEADALEYYLKGNGYTNSGDLNRFTAISQIHSMFFDGNWIHSLFGFGFGNCEGSQFEFLQSEFFLQYNHLHYRWFTHAWVYLEQGALGLVLLVLFFVSVFVTTLRRKSENRADLYLTVLLFVSTCFIGLIYNCAVQLECCYYIAFMCAITFILTRVNKEA